MHTACNVPTEIIRAFAKECHSSDTKVARGGLRGKGGSGILDEVAYFPDDPPIGKSARPQLRP